MTDEVLTSTAPYAEGDETSVRFHFPDEAHLLQSVRLWQEVRVPGEQLEFAPTERGWELVLPRPAVQRMEYMFQIHHADGGTETILDPSNPLVARGVFGDHSVLELPGYESPTWLAAEVVKGTRTSLEAQARGGLRRPVSLELWTPPDTAPDEPLPLLIAHDGPEYDELSRLTQFVGAQIAAAKIPPIRLALLAPGDRNARYAASPGYARTLVRSVLPTIAGEAPTVGQPMIMGASLGGLAALHAEYMFRGTFAGLFLQSGSFFQPRSDSQEGGFGRYGRIVDAVRVILTAAPSQRRADITMTCGVIEENVHNNRVMAAALTEQGHDVHYVEVPDVHTYTGWRDAFDPYLTDLLVRCTAELQA